MARTVAFAALVLVALTAGARAQLSLVVNLDNETLSLVGSDTGTATPVGGPNFILRWQNALGSGVNIGSIGFDPPSDYTLEPILAGPPALALEIESDGTLILEAIVSSFGLPSTITGGETEVSYAALSQSAKDVLALSDGAVLFLTTGVEFHDVGVVVESTAGPQPPAAYRADLLLDITANTDADGSGFTLIAFPRLEVDDEEPPGALPEKTDALVELRSPSGRSGDDLNDPDSGGVFTDLYTDASELTNELDGVWTFRVEEPNGQSFDYEVSISFALPFAQPPHLTTLSLVDGAPYAPPFDFQLVGGDAVQIGPETMLRGIIRVDNMFVTNFDIGQGDSPFTPPMFTPDGTETAIQFGLFTLAFNDDDRSAAIVSVTPLTPNAPALVIDEITTLYNAAINASLVPPPASLCAADFNGDLDVDLGDFGFFASAFGSSTGDDTYDARADFNNDGDVDLGDFGGFGLEFGNTPAECAP